MLALRCLRSVAVWVVGCVLVPGSCLAQGEAGATDSLKILSYNIHGLFRGAAKDHPSERMPTIGWLSRDYDVVLYQEDFEYHAELVRQLDQHVDFVADAIGGDWRRIAAKVLAVPVTIWIPHFSPPYGTGVSTAVRRTYPVVESSTAIYKACHGWFDSNADCWASKGFLRVRLRTPRGFEIDVYNTHLESGADLGSKCARQKQLEEMAQAMEELSKGRAVIVGGDFNVSYLRDLDRDMLTAFRQTVGLADSGAGPESPYWRERDFLLFRSSEAVRLRVVKAGEDGQFVKDRRALSDHPALAVTFEVEGIVP